MGFPIRSCKKERTHTHMYVHNPCVGVTRENDESSTLILSYSKESLDLYINYFKDPA